MMPPGPQGSVSDEFDSQLNDPGQYDNPQDPASLSVAEHLRALSVRGKLVLLYVAGAMTYLLLRFDLVSLLLADALSGAQPTATRLSPHGTSLVIHVSC